MPTLFEPAWKTDHVLKTDQAVAAIQAEKDPFAVRSAALNAPLEPVRVAAACRMTDIPFLMEGVLPKLSETAARELKKHVRMLLSDRNLRDIRELKQRYPEADFIRQAAESRLNSADPAELVDFILQDDTYRQVEQSIRIGAPVESDPRAQLTVEFQKELILHVHRESELRRVVDGPRTVFREIRLTAAAQMSSEESLMSLLDGYAYTEVGAVARAKLCDTVTRCIEYAGRQELSHSARAYVLEALYGRRLAAANCEKLTELGQEFPVQVHFIWSNGVSKQHRELAAGRVYEIVPEPSAGDAAPERRRFTGSGGISVVRCGQGTHLALRDGEAEIEVSGGDLLAFDKTLTCHSLRHKKPVKATVGSPELDAILSGSVPQSSEPPQPDAAPYL